MLVYHYNLITDLCTMMRNELTFLIKVLFNNSLKIKKESSKNQF